MNLKMFITNPATEGVLYGVGNNLAVTGASSPVAVNTGSALVYGIWYENDASVNVTIPTPASNPRIDRVVLRASWSAQTVRITRIAGTEAASPTAPALTQVANTTWDIPLYQVRITTGGVITLTDERTYIKHPGVYGWLNAAMTVNDTITSSKSNSGGLNEIAVVNTSNTAGSYARHLSKVGGASADDPLFVWEINGVLAWAMGLDNSDSDKMKIAPFSVIGSGDVLTLDSSGNLTVTGALSASSLNASQLGSGTVPLARLSGITTSQLSGSAGITSAQIAAVDAAKMTTGRLDTARLPVQYGSGTTSAGGTQSVTFGTAFSSTPVVFLQTRSGSAGANAFPTSVSTTGFTANTGAWNGANFAVEAANYYWVAIGAM